MSTLPTLPTAPVTLTGISSGTFGTPVYNWINFLADPPKFVGSNGAGQNITSGGASQALTIDTEEIDSVNGHDLVTNPTRYTAQYPGRYLCIATAVYPSNATGRRLASIRKNGATDYATDSGGTIGAVAGVLRVQSTRLVLLAAGDYVEAMLFQDSGATLSCNGGLQVVWVGTT